MASAHVRLIPFRAGPNLNFILEFGPEYIQIWEEGVMIAFYNTVFVEEDVNTVDYVQINDVLLLTHENHPPQKLTRTGASTFTLGEYLFRDNKAPLGQENLEAAKTLTYVSSTIDVTASSGTFNTSTSVNTRLWITNVGGTGISLMTLRNVDSTTEAEGVLNAGTVIEGATTHWGLEDLSGTNLSYNAQTGVLRASAAAFGAGDVNKKVFLYNLTHTFWVRIDTYNSTTSVSVTVLGGDIFTNATEVWALENTTATTMNGSGTSSHLLASFAAFDTTGRDNGRVVWFARIRYDSGEEKNVTDMAWAKISTVDSATKAFVDSTGGAPFEEATDRWALGLFSDKEGPSNVTLYDGRLIFGSSSFWPATISMSVSDDYPNFSPYDENLTDAANEDRAITRQISATELNTISWMVPTRNQLLVGTYGGVFSVSGGDNDFVTPLNCTVQRLTTVRCDALRPVAADNFVFFVQENRRKLRAINYDLSTDSYMAQDVSILWEHLATTSQMEQVVYQADPHGIIWIRRANGTLIAVTYEPQQKVIAATRLRLGGTDAKVLSLAVLPDPGTGYDTLYMLVRRHLGGDDILYIEKLHEFYQPTISYGSTPATEQAALESAFHVDCGKTVTNSPASTTVSGLSHLVGETVSALADGVVYENLVVSGTGTVTLPVAATTVHVGYPFTYRGETQRFLGGSRMGTDSGQVMRIQRVNLRVMNTAHLLVGTGERPAASELQEVDFETPGSLGGKNSFFRAGDRELPIRGGWNTVPTVYFESETPLPATILSIRPRMESNER